ncbi:MAG: hypothetical protein B7Y99_10725 [Caulobacterales bacterium 32-69-10]|nr:MAG: hypothetical protein B7Y99_10725 [Caulobacterales bacterium 32-69-10]
MRAAALLLGTVLVLLAACNRSGDSNPAPEPPADAPAEAAVRPTVDFSRPLNALGNEPFWALKIRPEGLSFSAPDAKDITARNEGPKVDTDQATWSAAGSDGAPLSVVLKAAVCEDGMSGLNYPFTATLSAGGKALSGCAAYADAMPREGG